MARLSAKEEKQRREYYLRARRKKERTKIKVLKPRKGPEER